MNGHTGETAEADSLQKRIVIVGSEGRLGRLLFDELRQRNLVVGLGRNALDLASADSIMRALQPLDYDYLFLTGALTAVDYCESHANEAFTINAQGPKLIAEISAEKGAHVTYISTDMVFDGMKAGSYLETDNPNPVSVYGASKLKGEQGVLAASADNLVARVSWVFGPGRPAFPEWIIDKARASKELTLPGDKTACPTYTSDLIGWLEALVFGKPERSASGTFHLCNSGSCSWREWGQFCIDIAREAYLPVMAGEIEAVALNSVAAFVAKRPSNSALDTTKFQTITGIHPRAWREAIREHVMQNIARPE